jgi:hypothetical protein
MDFGDIAWGGVNLIGLAQYRQVESFEFHNMLGELWSDFTTGGFSGSAQLHGITLNISSFCPSM